MFPVTENNSSSLDTQDNQSSATFIMRPLRLLSLLGTQEGGKSVVESSMGALMGKSCQSYIHLDSRSID